MSENREDIPDTGTWDMDRCTGWSRRESKDFKGTLKKLLHYLSMFKVQMVSLYFYSR